MTDETTGAAGTQADPDTQPPAGDRSSQADGGDSESTQPESMSLEEAKKLRAEAKSLRARLKAAEDAKTEADAAALSETDQKIAKAKQDGESEATSKWSSKIRRAEVKAALTAAGINNSVLDLATKADEFGELAVSDEGEIDGLGAAVATFKKDHPDLFTKPVQPGSSDGGTRGATRLTRAEVDRITKDPVQYDKRRDEVIDWLATQQQ